MKTIDQLVLDAYETMVRVRMANTGESEARCREVVAAVAAKSQTSAVDRKERLVRWSKAQVMGCAAVNDGNVGVRATNLQVRTPPAIAKIRRRRHA